MTNIDIQNEIIGNAKRNKDFFSGVIQRSILVRTPSGLKNIHTLFYCLPKEATVTCRPKLEFPPVEFFEELISLDEFERRVVEINDGKLQVGVEVILIPSQTFAPHAFLPANNLFGTPAGLEYQVQYHEPGGDIQLPNRFVSYDAPYYFINKDHAIKEWFCLTLDKSPFYSAGSFYFQKIHFFIPTGAYVDKILYKDNDIFFMITNLMNKDLRLRGYFQYTSGAGQPFNVPVKNGILTLKLKDSIESIELQLVAKGGELLDHIFPYDFLRGRRFAEVFAQKTKRDDVLELIEKAENEVCELKPFFPPRASSIDCQKTGKTIVAFANKNGGTVLIGIDDYLEIQDFSKLRDIMKDFGKAQGNDKEIIDQFSSLLKKELRDKVLDSDSDLRYTIEPVEVVDKHLIKINVERGNKIHQTRDGTVWYRRNGHTVRPNAKELQELYEKFKRT